MKVRNIIVIIVLVMIGFLLKISWHSTCKGGNEIPWWPNSGCECWGLKFSQNYKNSAIGGGKIYCLGVLKENR